MKTVVVGQLSRNSKADEEVNDRLQKASLSDFQCYRVRNKETADVNIQVYKVVFISSFEKENFTLLEKDIKADYKQMK